MLSLWSAHGRWNTPFTFRHCRCSKLRCLGSIHLPCYVFLAVGSPNICNLLAAIQCLQHQLRGSGLKFSSISVAAPLGVGSGLHCGGPGSAGGRATPEPFPSLESAPYLHSQDPACLLCALKSRHTCMGDFDVWIRASLHRQHADGSSAAHPMQAFAASPKNELPKRG